MSQKYEFNLFPVFCILSRKNHIFRFAGTFAQELLNPEGNVSDQL